MKKLAILTSILALTACGGGSGGSGGGGAGNSVTDFAAVSNANLTGMRTAIEVNAAGETVSSRAATSRFATLGNGNILYDLSDVDFKASDEDFGVKLKFVVDADKKVTGIKVINLDASEMSSNRIGDTNNFAGTVNMGDEVDAVLSYNSLGKEMGLAYSDFGNISIDVIDGWRPVFIGGYDVKKIDESEIETNATFTGKATGSVMAIRDGEGSGKGRDLDGNATLVFDTNGGNPTSTLTANFDNWYDVKYEKTGTTETATFTGGDVIDDPDFYLIDDANGDGKTTDVTNSDVRYFGDGTNPSEAVGIIQVRDCEGGGANCGNYDNYDEVRMNLGFGVKK